jgi:hypothetical protein
MPARIALVVLVLNVPAGIALAQSAGGALGWRRSDGSAVQQALATAPSDPAKAGSSGSSTSLTPVTGSRPASTVSTAPGALPHDQGQQWREYDLSPYTLRVTSTSRPEQAVVDWILRETGYEAWHGEPFGILSAGKRKLLVYHTPAMQQTVAEIVERFISSEAETHAFGLRLITIGHPNWRTKTQRLLKPVQVQTPGAQAWLLAREDAAVLLAEFQRRSDYREHSPPHLLVTNGQSNVVSSRRARNYAREVVARPNAWPGFEPIVGTLDEGYSLEFSPLLSADGKTIDATIKCEIDQIEKMTAVPLEVASPVAPRQRAQVEVPQLSQFRFHERFRWPVDQVLLVGMGTVPAPVPMESSLIPGVPLPLPAGPARVDLLIFVESKGKSGVPNAITDAGRGVSKPY